MADPIKKSSRVKVQSILSVVSSKPIEPGRFHRLSLLDQSAELHTLHLVFYYKSDPFLGCAMSVDAVDNLRATLSQLLDDYPVATGRLSRASDGGGGGGWIIKYNDAGVRMLHAAVSATVDEWLGSADAAEERDLTVWEDMPVDPTFWSPFRIQINNFKCGGLAIGLSCSHMHADITSATLLIKSWAEAHCGLPLSYSPIYDLPQPTPTPTPSPSFHLSPIATAPSKMATVTMKFSGEAMDRCLSGVRSEYPSVTSPFAVLAALFWSRIVRLQERALSSSLSSKHVLSICVDMRGWGSSVPYGYFGNALHSSELDLSDDCLMNGGLGTVSECIHRHVEGVKGDDYWSVARWLEDRRCKELPAGWPVRVYAPRLTCISMEHMVDAVEGGQALMYAAVFNKDGKNRPVHVSYRVGNVEGEGLIIVMPSAEGGRGRTITAALPEELVDDLCKDPAILDLEPTMILSGIRK